jgi:hypothetical protein
VSLFEITAKFGASALLRLVVLVLAFLALAALRSPLQVAVWLLTALMGVVDRTVSVRLVNPPPRARPAWVGEAGPR